VLVELGGGTTVEVKVAHCPEQTVVDGPVPAWALMLGEGHCATPDLVSKNNSIKTEILFLKKLIMRSNFKYYVEALVDSCVQLIKEMRVSGVK
jgi:hypothetical protein